MHHARSRAGVRSTIRTRAARYLVSASLSVLAVCAAAATAVPAAAQASSASARAALSSTYVKEQGQLHFSSKSGGSAIAEQGSATGTFKASLDIDLTIKISQVTGSFVAYLKGGSISGSAAATPHYSGQWVSFKGTLTIKHGTGSYAGASGTASLYGSLNREQLKLNVQVIGRLRL
ncbi:MAG: hypothetical protein WB698_03330 [Solirubrobacteraceae bacterium]